MTIKLVAVSPTTILQALSESNITLNFGKLDTTRDFTDDTDHCKTHSDKA